MRLPLKDYQKETLARLADYCAAARDRYDGGVNRFERDAYEHVTGAVTCAARFRERALRLSSLAHRRRQDALGGARAGNYRR